VIDTFREILRGAIERLSRQMQHDLPPVLAAAVILLLAYMAARFVRWLVLRAVKGIEWDLWLRRSGLVVMIDRSGTLHVSRLLAQAAYWCILTLGLLGALNALSTETTSRLAAGILSVLPRALAAGAVLLTGLWLGQYLGSGALVWAVNEELPAPRRLALGVRALVVFAAVVAAADILQFAASVFLWAFILTVGGVALAGGLAVGLGAGDALRRHLSERAEFSRAEERSLWNHL
jgi:hypothetical protein